MIGGGSVIERVRVGLLIFVALFLQQALLLDIRVDGVRADVLLLVAIVAGTRAGPEQGAVVGFIAGVVSDLFAQTPLGLSALSFSIVGFAVGMVQTSVLRTSWWIGPLTAGLASVAGVVIFGVAGAVVGQPYLVGPRLAVIASAVGVLNAILSPVIARLGRWAYAGRAERTYVTT